MLKQISIKEELDLANKEVELLWNIIYEQNKLIDNIVEQNKKLSSSNTNLRREIDSLCNYRANSVKLFQKQTKETERLTDENEKLKCELAEHKFQVQNNYENIMKRIKK